MTWNRIRAHVLFYPTFGWNFVLGRVFKIRNWWDPIHDQIILGAMPLARDVPKLAILGVRAVVNACEEYEGPVQQYQAYSIEQLRTPTVDFTPPAYQDLVAAVDFIDHQIAAGHKVYVHCKAGRARSATIVLCWLIKNQGITAEQAQSLLLEKRPHVSPSLSRRAAVQRFESEFGSARK
jgi:atypical dual specificity phosphatase